LSANINISNYESYLLSYVDGELNAEEISALEALMEKHPGIREELALLNSVKMQPEKALVFENKASLYRGASALSLENYEEYLLSYVDNELSASELSAVEQFLEQYPQKRQELAWLQATRQQPDLTVRFEDKSVLYRHAAKTRVIHPRIWWGVAAAVVAGMLVWLLPFNQQNEQRPAIVKTVPPAPAAPTEKVLPSAAPTTSTESTPAVIAQATPVPVKVTKPAGSVGTKKVVDKVATPPVAVPDQEVNAAQVPVVPEKNDAPVLAQLAPPRNTSKELVESQVAESKVSNLTVTIKEPVMANNTPIERNVHLEQPSTAPAPAPVRGELIASVSGSDSKLLDKVTNVAKLFSKRKR
jgi:anti-sigma factor RsiW